MKPWILVGEAIAPGGGKLVLSRRDGELAIKVDGSALMSSRSHGSEEAMAEAGLGEAGSSAAVLVGGLGFGYTLRAVLDRLGPLARVTVAELSTAIVEWNRGPLASLAGHPLADPRVKIEARDVQLVLRGARAAYDAILLDVDNGPQALTARSNHRLYQREGIALLARALRPGGRLVVWSAGPDAAYEERVRKGGFALATRSVAARAGGRGGRHVLFVATNVAAKTETAAVAKPAALRRRT